MPSDRARRRTATMSAIKQSARQLLVDDGPAGVGLRAIARELGLTAPALYRYVGSHEELMELLVADIYDELTATLEQAADSPGDSPGMRLGAASWAFRRWSLDHPAEFGLVFANPIRALEETGAAARFANVFERLFVELWALRPFPVPDESELGDSVVRQLRQRVPDLPPGAAYVFVWCWSRLYGAVCLEVFGHLQWAFDDGEPVFEQTMAELAGKLAGKLGG